ncbi:MAG: MFS transporter [Fischerella sp. CENA71]|nr:MFS transporter [Fischerella sp. CENA71]
MTKYRLEKGMRVFLIIWFGQMVSVIGSGLTGFALDIWIYQRTGSVTQFAFAFVFSQLPPILISPFAGALVDRWNRRYCMILSDLGAGLSTLAIALLLFAGNLQIWHIYIATALSSIFGSFQWPAYSASIPMLVPKEHLNRANGLTELAGALTMLLPPVLGGALLVTINLQGVILIDFITFLVSIVTLLSVRFPKMKTDTTEEVKKISLLADVIYGWKYITSRPGLLALIYFFAASNFVLAIVSVLLTPLVLSFTSPAILGLILSIDGVGMLVGTLVVTTRKGPTRQIYTILGFQMLGGLCILVTGLRTSAPLIAVAAFLFAFGSPIINCSSQVIWQRKVAPEVQGRVFALEQMIVGSLQPVAYIVSGPLADRVFEPLMAANGLLAASLGQIIGVGKGRGIGLLFIVMGIISMLISVIAFQYRHLRFLEDELLDQI